MKNIVDETKKKIAKLDQAAAIALVREVREQVNTEAHKLREQAQGLSDLLRTLEPAIDTEARKQRRRGTGFSILPNTDKAKE